MTRYELADSMYINATPAGAYYAACDPRPNPIRSLMFGVLTQPDTPELECESIRRWSRTEDEHSAIEWLHRAETMGLLEGRTSREALPEFNIERDVPLLLQEMTDGARGLLADDEGFYLANHGFNHETAEEVSALSADVASLHARHAGLLERNLNLQSAAWAVVDAAGNSQLGIWPLYVGERRFALVLDGAPSFNGRPFHRLMSALCRRYYQ